MTPASIVAVGLLTGVGVYLVLARKVFSVILGLSLLTHAANLMMLAAGDAGKGAPIVVDGVARHSLADPMPQALVLTAIVISLAVTLYLLAVFAASARVLGIDEVVRATASDAGTDKAEVRRELAGQGRQET
ncbi:MAG: NADH-quinone oxidoreductase subunit K [Thermoanaerobaculia bacterium]|jgi:multicomponent K+:H+ antiporter subunit C